MVPATSVGGGLCPGGWVSVHGIGSLFKVLGLCPRGRVSVRGGAWMEHPHPPPPAAIAAVGTHPTGMQSCTIKNHDD